ncbi:hypothetical protein LJC56_07490 [Christensenellaceae bacterium OttesenSCG-928-K19]|nr:hypothetical protein [Christensenellaceae bacterium OttesenSCG-928-K19]
MNTTPHKATVEMNANTWAMLVYLISLGIAWITGVYYFAWVFPFVIYITEKVSGFVRFHAMQAVTILIINAITALISDIIYIANAPADMFGALMEGFLGVSSGPNPGDVIWIITTIVWDIFLVLGAVSASKYETKPLPLFGAFAKTLAGMGNKNPGASPFEPDPAKQQQYWQAQQYKQQQQQYQQQQPQGYGQQPPQGQAYGQPQPPVQQGQPMQGQPGMPPVQQGQPMQGQPGMPPVQQGQPMQGQPGMPPVQQGQPMQGQPGMPPYQGQPQPNAPQQQPYMQPPQQGQMPPQGQPPYGQAPPQGQMPPQGQYAPPPQQQGPAAGAPQEWYRTAPQQPVPQQQGQQFEGKQSGYFTSGERKVDVDRNNYTGEEIMDRLLRYAQLPGQPYFKKMWNRNYVVIPGAGTKDMMINHTGMPGQFILTEIDRPGTIGKSVLMAGLTSGMADVFESATSNLNQLMDQVANELYRLFGRK